MVHAKICVACEMEPWIRENTTCKGNFQVKRKEKNQENHFAKNFFLLLWRYFNIWERLGLFNVNAVEVKKLFRHFRIRFEKFSSEKVIYIFMWMQAMMIRCFFGKFFDFVWSFSSAKVLLSFAVHDFCAHQIYVDRENWTGSTLLFDGF